MPARVDQDDGTTGSAAPSAAPAYVPRRRKAPASLPRSPFRLRNWRVRSRLLALVVIPTVAAIALGGVRIEAARSTADEFARVHQLALLGGDITALAQSVEDERDLTAGYVAAQQSGDSALAQTLSGELTRQYATTGAHVLAMEKVAALIGPGYPSAAQSDLEFAQARVAAVADLRALSHTQMNALPLISDYSNVVSALLAFDNDIAVGSSNPQLAQTVSSLAELAQLEGETSQQRALLYATLIQGQFQPGALQDLINAQAAQSSDTSTFQTVARNLPAYTSSGPSPTLTAVQQFTNIVAGPGVDQGQAIEQGALISAGNGQPPIQPAGGPQEWFSAMSATLSDMRTVESNELASTVAQASALQSSSEGSETLTAVIVFILLLIVLAVTVIIARSMIVPLRRLRTDALEVAGRRLPDMVRRLSESQGSVESIQIDPVGVDSADEIGEVARAFDQVHREAIRLAGEEALLRTNLNAMFVNLSRRSQSLIERQLGIIDSLEQSEADPDRLSSLFRLDHLATRMRRNSENLLVLAGHEAPRKWSQPVPLVDVLRASVSEIEQYDRITLNVHAGVVVAGRAASDVVHLAAEILENATAFSPEDTPVLVSGQQVPSGGVLLEIVDNGLGISEQDLAYANWRLESPPVVDVAVSRRMGLFVVGRLAARHGIRVRLQHGNSGGLCALIWLPETVASAEAPAQTPFTGRFRPDNPVPAAAGTRRRMEPFAVVGSRGPGAAGMAAETRDRVRSLAPTTASIEGAGANDREWSGAATAAASDAWLPIFDSVESEWFRRGGNPSGGAAWTSLGDAGFRAAAKTVSSPVTGDMTTAGLPRRVPNANLVPGSVGGPGAAAPPMQNPPNPPSVPADAARSDAAAEAARSSAAEAARSRMAGFSRGGRAGRAAAAEG